MSTAPNNNRIAAGSAAVVDDEFDSSGRYFKDGVRAIFPTEKEPMWARILPALDDNMSPHDAARKTSFAPYRDMHSGRVDNEVKGGTPAFTSWFVLGYVYQWLGRSGMSFTSPKQLTLAGITADQAPCPVMDLARTARLDARFAGLTKKQADPRRPGKEIVPLPGRPKVKAAMNAVAQIKGQLTQGLLVTSAQSLGALKETLSWPTSYGQQPRDPNFQQFLLGDVTHPNTGLLTCIKIVPPAPNSGGFPYLGFHFTERENCLGTERVFPVGPEALANRYDLGSLDIWRIPSYQEIVDMLVGDGAFPLELIHIACGHRANVRGGTGMTGAPGAIPGAAVGAAAGGFGNTPAGFGAPAGAAPVGGFGGAPAGGFGGAPTGAPAGFGGGAPAGFGGGAPAGGFGGAPAGAPAGFGGGAPAGFGGGAPAGFGGGAPAGFGAPAGAPAGFGGGAPAGFGGGAPAGGFGGAPAGAPAGFGGAPAGAPAGFGAPAGAPAGFGGGAPAGGFGGAPAGAPAGFGAPAGAPAGFGGGAPAGFGGGAPAGFGAPAQQAPIQQAPVQQAYQPPVQQPPVQQPPVQQPPAVMIYAAVNGAVMQTPMTIADAVNFARTNPAAVFAPSDNSLPWSAITAMPGYAAVAQGAQQQTIQPAVQQAPQQQPPIQQNATIAPGATGAPLSPEENSELQQLLAFNDQAAKTGQSLDTNQIHRMGELLKRAGNR